MPSYFNHSTEELKKELIRLKKKKRETLIRSTESDIDDDIRHIVRILHKRERGQ